MHMTWATTNPVMQTKESINHPTTKFESGGRWNPLNTTWSLFLSDPKTIQRSTSTFGPTESWFEVVGIVVKVGDFILYDLFLLPA